MWRAADDTSRISLADIETEGPFSSFPGRRRLLTLVHGPVLGLVVDGAEVVIESGRPFAFDGAAQVVASLPEGSVRVLNVMVETGAVEAEVIEPYVTVLELGRTSVLPLAEDQSALVMQGRAVAEGVEAPASSLVVGPAEVSGRCTLAVITLQRV